MWTLEGKNIVKSEKSVHNCESGYQTVIISEIGTY